MACINMFNPSSDAHPRISFSNDFVVDPAPSAPTHDRICSDPDFEFTSAGSRPMMAADELFFKGRMLPLRGGGAGNGAVRAQRVTLREELRAREDDARPPRAATRWREFLGLKRAGSCGNGKKGEREGADQLGAGKGTQEQCSDGSGRGKDVEMGF